MPKSENLDPLDWLLSREDRGMIVDSLVNYMVDHDLRSADVEVTG